MNGAARRPAPDLAAACFAAIGEILMDFTPVVEGGEVAGFRARPGGSPANIAVGLARCGARVEFVAKISTDAFGRRLLRHLEREGVGTRWVSRAAAPTTLAFAWPEGEEASFSFYGAEAADTLLGPEDLPDAIEAVNVLHCGSNSLAAAPTADTVVGLARRLRGRCVISCDPNIRPSLVRDAARYRRRLDEVLRAADVLKVSRADLGWLWPGRSIEDAAAALRALGPALVVVTLGAEGCRARTPGAEARVSAFPVEVVDTVGAGDAFMSGLLVGLAERALLSRTALGRIGASDLHGVLRFAAAAAAITCTRPGADPPRLEEIERFLSR